MGRGGGGGSSHHSSHHSSSHSHSGGSRSSYSSSRSSYSSSGSSYRSSGSSYRSTGSSYSHHSTGSYGSGSYGSSAARSGGGCCLGGCLTLFAPVLVIFFVVAGIITFYCDATGKKFEGSFFIERSTINRVALPEAKCTPVDEWYKGDWGDWIDKAGEEEALINGLKHFYEKTGVQPYVWIMGEEGKDYMSEGSVEELGNTTYKKMFGNDEGHLILIFREYPNESGNYIVTATPGYDAETQVMDEQAREILLDYIDYYYTDSDLNEGQFFGKAFEQAGDRIMTKQLSMRQTGLILFISAFVIIGLLVVANIIKKRKIAVAKQKALQKQAEAQQAKAVAAQKQTEFNQQKYNDQLELQFVAVECPNCGSTGNKIRKATVGYCPYCGTAIRVDQEGKVSFINRDASTLT